MANTRQSAKRARLAKTRQARNQSIRTETKTVVKKFLAVVQSGDSANLKALHQEAIRALAKAGTKGAMPKKRAARKTSRLARLLQKTLSN
jgi:small subunit ribosomal protein S20